MVRVFSLSNNHYANTSKSLLKLMRYCHTPKHFFVLVKNPSLNVILCSKFKLFCGENISRYYKIIDRGSWSSAHGILWISRPRDRVKADQGGHAVMKSKLKQLKNVGLNWILIIILNYDILNWFRLSRPVLWIILFSGSSIPENKTIPLRHFNFRI